MEVWLRLQNDRVLPASHKDAQGSGDVLELELTACGAATWIIGAVMEEVSAAVRQVTRSHTAAAASS